MKQLGTGAALLLLAACSAAPGDPHQTFDDHGAQTCAEEYYQLLIDGKTNDYVRNIAGSDTIDKAMYTQLVDLMDQYLAHEQQIHQGIKKAVATGDSLHVQDSLATVYLDVTYNDSTTEHISLPLHFHHGHWLIK